MNTVQNLPIETRLQFTLGDRLSKAMRAADVTRADIAEYLGVSPTTIGNYTSDRVPVKKQTLRLWSMRTGVPLTWLETGEFSDPLDGPGRGPHLGNATIQYHNSPVIMRPVVDLSTIRAAS